MQQLSYRWLEITSQYPLHLMGSAMETWMHGGDPLPMLQAEQRLSELNRRYDQDPAYFSNLIRQKMLNNTHRLTLVVKPDRGVQAVKDAEFTRKMAELKKSLSAAELEGIARKQAELDAALDAPNPPEAMAALPQLHASDLPRKPRHIPTSVEKLPGGVTLLRNEVFANGISYLHMAFDVTGLAADLYPYLPLYGDCVHKMGAAGKDFVTMAQRVAANTGGVGFAFGTNGRVDEASGLLRQAVFTTKFLDPNSEKGAGRSWATIFFRWR